MRIFENTSFDFISKRRIGYVISGTLVLISLISFVTRGIGFGIDFQSGMEFVISTDEPLSATNVRTTLSGAFGTDPEVKTYDTPGQLLIRTIADREISEAQALLVNTVASEFPGSNPQIVKTDVVGPRFAEDLKRGALWSVLGALLVIFVYIMIRFQWRYSVGAIAALAHDAIVTLGLFSLLRGILPFSLDVDQSIIAALLTIVGYSINDTVVIFDRVREYNNLFKTAPIGEVVNRAINSTLSRTFMTSFTTLIVVLALFIFGGEVLRGFAFALIVGIIAGTYSTIFVASPMMLELHKRFATARAVAPARK